MDSPLYSMSEELRLSLSFNDGAEEKAQSELSFEPDFIDKWNSIRQKLVMSPQVYETI